MHVIPSDSRHGKKPLKVMLKYVSDGSDCNRNRYLVLQEKPGQYGRGCHPSRAGLITRRTEVYRSSEYDETKHDDGYYLWVFGKEVNLKSNEDAVHLLRRN